MTKNKDNPSTSGKYPLWYYAILILIPIIFFLLLEFFLQIFGYGADYSVFTKAYSAYPDYLFLNPNITHKYFTNVSAPPTTIADPFREKKSANAYRVFVLGESSVAGWPYVPNASFPRILKRKLQLYYPESEIEVINLGISAINSYTLKDFTPAILQQKPDLVIIYTGHNEYYGALGVASSQNLGNSSILIDSYITLKKFKTFQLIMNSLNSLSIAFSSNHSEQNLSQNETLMERMVGNNLIPYRSELFQEGIHQFENNISQILSKLTDRNCPVIIGSLVSNLADLPPFESIKDSDENALSYYELGKKELVIGNSNSARKLLRKAKDLDALRFRAPSEFNDIIKSLSRKFNIPCVELDTIFDKASVKGVVGNDFIVDHLHPNVEGYSLIAESFFNEIIKSGLAPKTQRNPAPDSILDGLLNQKFPFSELDSTIASLRIRILTGAYPFVPKGKPNKLIKDFNPVNIIDSLSIEVVDRWTTWEQAHYRLSQRYFALGYPDKAKKELEILLFDRPLNINIRKELITLLISIKSYTEALNHLVNLNNESPDAFSYKWIGAIALEQKDYVTAIANLLKSLDFSQNDPQVWYNLSGAYYLDNQINKALFAIQKCIELEPRNQVAVEFYNQLRSLQ